MFILKKGNEIASSGSLQTNLCRSIFWFGIKEKGRSLDMIKPSKKKKKKDETEKEHLIIFSFFFFLFFVDDDYSSLINIPEFMAL